MLYTMNCRLFSWPSFSQINTHEYTNTHTHTHGLHSEVWFISWFWLEGTWQLLSFSSIYIVPLVAKVTGEKTPLQVLSSSSTLLFRPLPPPTAPPPSLMAPWIIPSSPSNPPTPPFPPQPPQLPQSFFIPANNLVMKYWFLVRFKWMLLTLHW